MQPQGREQASALAKRLLDEKNPTTIAAVSFFSSLARSRRRRVAWYFDFLRDLVIPP